MWKWLYANRKCACVRKNTSVKRICNSQDDVVNTIDCSEYERLFSVYKRPKVKWNNDETFGLNQNAIQ